MRLGVFGGTFDPVHYGHLLLAEQCREQCQLDEVRLIPAGIPPHKNDSDVTDGAHRLEMLKLATAGHEQLTVCDMELHRSGPSFTFETLEKLCDEEPQRELFLIIGADSLRDFPAWRNPQRILELAMLIVVNRGDQPEPDLGTLAEKFGDLGKNQATIVTIPGIGLSSSDIRKRVSDGKSIRYMTPRAVECYIETHGIYQC